MTGFHPLFSITCCSAERSGNLTQRLQLSDVRVVRALLGSPQKIADVLAAESGALRSDPSLAAAMHCHTAPLLMPQLNALSVLHNAYAGTTESIIDEVCDRRVWGLYDC